MVQDDNTVTIAILQNEIKHLGNDVRELNGSISKVLAAISEVDKVYQKRLVLLERSIERLEERWGGHREEHKRENKTLAMMSVIESALAAVAGVLVRP